MTLITADTLDWIYLLHFARPLGNLANARAQASHYLGYALDVQARVAQHARGHGSALTRAAVAQGITWQVFYRAGTPALERALKERYKSTPKLCPLCQAALGRGTRAGFLPLDQLALPLDDFDFPAPPAGRVDWFEISHLRTWRAQRALLTPPADASRLDDLL